MKKDQSTDPCSSMNHKKNIQNHNQVHHGQITKNRRLSKKNVRAAEKKKTHYIQENNDKNDLLSHKKKM